MMGPVEVITVPTTAGLMTVGPTTLAISPMPGPVKLSPAPWQIVAE
jgi:hypothetical protein